MSAGPFERTFYEDNQGAIHPIRVQPETIEFLFGITQNAPPVGPVDSDISARVTGSRRGVGLFARYVTIVFTGAVPDGYSLGQYYKIAILTQAVYDAITLNGACTYLEEAAQVISKTAEVQG